jgi:hypothetical protein
MRDLECKCVCSSEIRDCAELLLDGNPRLTREAAADYARKICVAEYQDDYVAMHKFIQEALYGWGDKNAA